MKWVNGRKIESINIENQPNDYPDLSSLAELQSIVQKQAELTTKVSRTFKSPNGFLNKWVMADEAWSISPPHLPIIGYDGALYCMQSEKVTKIDDITDAVTTKTIGFDWGASGISFPQKMFVFPSGIVYIVNGTTGENVLDIYKAPDILTQPTLTTTLTGGHAVAFSNSHHFDGVNEYVFVSQYESNNTTTKQVYFSKDGGETFQSIKTVEGTDPDSGYYHFHAVEFDSYSGRIWASEGDGSANRSIWYSDDQGVTWDRIDSDAYQPTLILPLPNGVFFGRDAGEAGLYKYERQSKVNDIQPVSELEDALTFRTDSVAVEWYPTNNFAKHNGSEAYVTFAPVTDDSLPTYIYATGDGGNSWHCVYSGMKEMKIVGIQNGYVIANAKSPFHLHYMPLLEWQ